MIKDKSRYESKIKDLIEMTTETVNGINQVCIRFLVITLKDTHTYLFSTSVHLSKTVEP